MSTRPPIQTRQIRLCKLQERLSYTCAVVCICVRFGTSYGPYDVWHPASPPPHCPLSRRPLHARAGAAIPRPRKLGRAASAPSAVGACMARGDGPSLRSALLSRTPCMLICTPRFLRGHAFTPPHAAEGPSDRPRSRTHPSSLTRLIEEPRVVGRRLVHADEAGGGRDEEPVDGAGGGATATAAATVAVAATEGAHCTALRADAASGALATAVTWPSGARGDLRRAAARGCRWEGRHSCAVRQARQALRRMGRLVVLLRLGRAPCCGGGPARILDTVCRPDARTAEVNASREHR
eukprot:355422-Chlamydomonas_euryale.AAC.2